ncbi:Tigger transposable element-derived protein 4 [Dictyocoela muelleri]|nr:Tigger transposable element-derived protein 4 [Dictyocoela muelleri]
MKKKLNLLNVLAETHIKIKNYKRNIRYRKACFTESKKDAKYLLSLTTESKPNINSDALNDMVYSAFCCIRERGFPINGTLLKIIAMQISEKFSIAKFSASNGWIHRFKKKYGLSFRVVKGESKSSDHKNAVLFIENFYIILEKYEKRNIFNCDETALFYKCMPNKSYVTAEDSSLGYKSYKERLTLLLSCSFEGEKLHPLIIGKYKSPRCLKDIDVKSLNIEYESIKRAWMTRDLFLKWLMRLNIKFRNEN